MLILEDLYLGEVRPGERSGKRNQQYKKAVDALGLLVGDIVRVDSFYKELCADKENRKKDEENDVQAFIPPQL